MRWLFLHFFATAALGGSAFGADSIEKLTSISNAYESRSVFTNPAALGFQTDLNGAPLLSSFTYAVDQGTENEFSGSLSLGYFGLGVEHLADTSSGNMFNRFDFALGIPLVSRWYLGTRYRFTRADSPLLDHINSWDVGLQWRPSDVIAFGVTGVQLNRPQLSGSGSTLPARLAVGTTIRPWQPLELSLDVETNSDNFAKQFATQITASWELATGLFVRAGYQSTQKFLVGLQLNFDRAQVYSVGQPAPESRSVTAGVQLSTKPYRSFLKPDALLKMDIDNNLHEASSRGGLFRTERPALLGLLRRMEKAGKDRSIRRIALKIEDFPLGLAAAQEVRQAILRLRDLGKEVDVFLANAGIKEYLIASGATTVHLEPTAEIRFVGLRSERYYLKGTLDKIGVEGQFLARGKYKSAPEMFTRTESSDPSREETLEQLREAESLLFHAISQSRSLTQDRWNTLLNTALLDAEGAKTAGLIDAIDHMEDVIKAQPLVVREDLEETSDRLALPSRVAVIVASGDILQRRIPLLSVAGESQVTPERVRQHFEEAMGDSRTKAIVFRVSSPGGEVVASDEIAALVKTADKKGKPVVISMGDVAASGGYMISAPARRIFADPLTVTGSIGVFLGKFNLGELYKKIGLHKEILTDAPFAALLTEDRPWTIQEREILWRRLNQYYDGFVKYVSDYRRLPLSQVEEVAQGRVWLGSAALKHHLVDAEGGYFEAIRYAAEQAQLSPDQIEVHMIEDPRGLFDFFTPEDVFARDPLATLGAGFLSPDLIAEIRWMSRLRETPFLYLSPIRGLQE